MMEEGDLETFRQNQELYGDQVGEEMDDEMGREQGVAETGLDDRIHTRSQESMSVKQEMNLQDNQGVDLNRENVSSVDPTNISQPVAADSDYLGCSFCHQAFLTVEELVEHQECHHVKKEFGGNQPRQTPRDDRLFPYKGCKPGSQGTTGRGQSPHQTPEGELLNMKAHNSCSDTDDDSSLSGKQCDLTSQKYTAITKDLQQSEKRRISSSPSSQCPMSSDTLAIASSKSGDASQDGASSDCLYGGDVPHGSKLHTRNSNKQHQGLAANNSRLSTQEQKLASSQRLATRSHDQHREMSYECDDVEGRIKQEVASSSKDISQASSQHPNDLSDLRAIQSRVNLDFKTIFPSANLKEDQGLRKSNQLSTSSIVTPRTKGNSGKKHNSKTKTTLTGAGASTSRITTSSSSSGEKEESSLSELDVHSSKVHQASDLENYKLEGATASYNLRKYPCFYCGKRFTRSSHRSDHERSHNINSQFKCSYCDKYFTRKRVMLAHEKLHKQKKIGKFRCRKCNKNFITKEEKKEHLKMHLELRRYKCNMCNKSYKFSSHLRDHERIHDIDSQFKCSYCIKYFTRKRQLVIHENQHEEKAGNFECKLCKIKFKTIKAKRKHQQSHINERKYMCSYCGKAYKFSSHCRDHERSHNIKSQFKCSYCQMSFTKKRVMLTHEMTHAMKGGVKDEKQGGKEEEKKDSQSRKTEHFVCWRCKMTFQTRAEKKRHHETHLTERRYLCCFCGKQFKYCGHCKEHEKAHKMSARLKCPLCNKSFTKKRLITAHVQQHIVSRLCTINQVSGKDKVNQGTKTNQVKQTKQKKALCVSEHILLGDGKFPCRFCQKVYMQKFQLRVHEVIQHQYMQKCRLRGFLGVTNKQVVERVQVRKKCKGESNKEIVKIGTVLTSLIDQDDDGHQQEQEKCQTNNVDMEQVGNGDNNEEQTDEEMLDHYGDDQSGNTSMDASSQDHNTLSICEFCDRTFRTHKGMLSHQKKKHKNGKEPYSCPDCPLKFSAREERDTHLRQHLSERPFQCRFCPKRFKKAHHCREHELLHDVASQFKCIYCDKGFTCKRYLQKHQLGQRSKKPFRCQNCSQIFSIKSCLLHHEKMCGLKMINKDSKLCKSNPCIEGADQVKKKNDDETTRSKQSQDSDSSNSIPEESQDSSEKGGRDPSSNQNNDGDETNEEEARKLTKSKPNNIAVNKDEKHKVQDSRRNCQNASSDVDMFEGTVLQFLENMIDAHVNKNIASSDGIMQTSKTLINADKKEKVFKCKFCRVVFESEAIWVKHEFLHTSKEPLSCWYCHMSFASEELKIEHEASHRQGAQLCQKCGTVFKSEFLLRTHSCHDPHADMDYKCERCNLKFADPQGLLEHEKSHRGRRAYACSYCRARFVNSDSYQHHIQSQHGVTSSVERKPTRNRYLACKFCRKSFWKESNLEMHEKGHTGLKPYCCAYCKATFQNQALLLRHEDTHAADRPQQCSICGYRFKERKKLIDHTFRHGESQFRCEHCTRQFNNEYDFFKHEKAHPDVRLYTCRICGEQFACDVNRLLHTRQKHNVLIPCPLCGQQLLTSSALARHLIEHKKKNQSPSRSHQVASNIRQSPRRIHTSTQHNSMMSPGKVLYRDTRETTVVVAQESVPECSKDSNAEYTSGQCCGDEKNINVSGNVSNPKLTEENKPGCDYSSKLRNRYPTRNLATQRTSDAPTERDMSSAYTCDSDVDIIETFQCKYCAKTFSDRKNCYRHENLHVPEKLWKCIVCGTSYFTKDLLVKHIKTDQHKMQAEKKKKKKKVKKTVAKTKKVQNQQSNSSKLQAFFRCVYCNKVLTSQLALKNHSKLHGGPNPYRCRYCSSAFSVGILRDKHEVDHLPERPFQCRFCGRRFKRCGHRTEHERRHDEARQFKCEVCNSGFTRPIDLWRHEQKHPGKGAYICDICSAAFFSFSNLQYHWKLKHGTLDAPWKKQKVARKRSRNTLTKVKEDLDEIPKKKQKILLKKTENKEETDISRAFQCPKCQACFKNRYHLAEHVVTHDPQSQHKCEVCNKRFVRLIVLWRHEKSHRGKRKHRCPQCGSRFFNKGSVKYHLKIEHGVKMYLTIKPKDRTIVEALPVRIPNGFKCNVCSKMLSSKNHLEEHERIHDPSLQFCCEVCGKGFTRRIRLWRHEVIHKGGERKYKCAHCRARFFSKGSWEYHLRTHKMKITPKRPSRPEVFTCPHCSKTFGNAEVARRHEANHNRESRHACTYEGCNEKFTSIVLMTKHFITVHPSDRPFKCGYCSQQFKQYGHFISHEKKHRPEMLPYVCEICQKGFVRPRALFRHEQNHRGERLHKCPKCSVRCFNKVSIMYHMLSLHGIPYRQQGLYKLKKYFHQCHGNRPSVHTHLTKKRTSPRQRTVRTMQSDIDIGSKIAEPKLLDAGDTCSKGTVDNLEVPEDHIAKIECKDARETSEKQNLPNQDVIEVTEDNIHICELCTEEFNSERELRRHKRFHSVEIEAMQSLLQNLGSSEQSEPIPGVKQEVNIKREPVIVTRSKNGTTLKRGRGRPKKSLAHHCKSKNSRTKVIQRRTRRAAFRHGIMKRRNGEKKKVAENNKMEHILKRLSWNTGVETSTVVESRFRFRSPQKEEDGNAETERRTMEEGKLSESTSDPDDDVKVASIPTRRLRSMRDHKEKMIINGHIPSSVSHVSLESKLKNMMDISTRTTKQRNKSNFLSLLKETEKEREDGMAFVSRVMPVLYNGHCRSCIQCGKRFDTDKALAEHQKWHTCSKRIKCLECNKWCENDKEYRVHWQEHALHRLLYCKHCGRDFPDKELLWRHEKTHNKDGNGNGSGGNVRATRMMEKPHVCDMCSESFITEDELKLHQVSHTAPRAFVCEHCSMSFNQERQLRSHQTRHIGDLATWQKSFGCPLCGGMFRSSDDLKTHERTFHGSEGGFQCKYCERSFAVEKNWRAHEEVHRINKDKRRSRRK